jgi:hypothetical protein
MAGRVISVPIQEGLVEMDDTKDAYYGFAGGIDYYVGHGDQPA